jgi:hypothetical protein
MARFAIAILLIALSCKHAPDGPRNEEYEATRAAVRTLSPAVASAFGQAIDQLEHDHASTVYVTVAADLESTKAATEWVKTRASAYPGASASTVFPFYISSSTTPGDDLAVRELTSAFARLVPGGVIRFEKYSDKDVGPRIDVRVDVKPVSVFTPPGGHRVYAALDCTYSASMHVGSANTPLASGIVASAPDAITLARRAFEGDKLAQIGETPSIDATGTFAIASAGDNVSSRERH